MKSDDFEDYQLADDDKLKFIWNKRNISRAGFYFSEKIPASYDGNKEVFYRQSAERLFCLLDADLVQNRYFMDGNELWSSKVVDDYDSDDIDWESGKEDPYEGIIPIGKSIENEKIGIILPTIEIIGAINLYLSKEYCQ